mmetsp:Transcript_26782/g.49194  ORF Transcript_26782/g.49194 Transcript_26782/m.49194 type:complete len:951 (-) Transcript_26782:531-3383(-)
MSYADTYVGECFIKCAHIILASRLYDRPRRLSDLKCSQWFLLEHEEVDGVAVEIEPWRRNFTAPLIIEFYAKPRRAHDSKTPDEAVQLERWTLSYNRSMAPPPSTVASISGTRNVLETTSVYKRLTLLVRALYSYARVLPAFRISRAAVQLDSKTTALRYPASSSSSVSTPPEITIHHVIGSSPSSSLPTAHSSATPPSTSSSPTPSLSPSPAVAVGILTGRRHFSFSPVFTPFGAFTISVESVLSNNVRNLFQRPSMAPSPPLLNHQAMVIADYLCAATNSQSSRMQQPSKSAVSHPPPNGLTQGDDTNRVKRDSRNNEAVIPLDTERDTSLSAASHNSSMTCPTSLSSSLGFGNTPVKSGIATVFLSSPSRSTSLSTSATTTTTTATAAASAKGESWRGASLQKPFGDYVHGSIGDGASSDRNVNSKGSSSKNSISNNNSLRSSASSSSLACNRDARIRLYDESNHAANGNNYSHGSICNNQSHDSSNGSNSSSSSSNNNNNNRINNDNASSKSSSSPMAPINQSLSTTSSDSTSNVAAVATAAAAAAALVAPLMKSSCTMNNAVTPAGAGHMIPPEPYLPRYTVDESGNIQYEWDPNYLSSNYEVFDLRVIHRRSRTGFEETKDFPIRMNDLIAGRYQVLDFLGSAAFSSAVQALDIKTGSLVCLKIIKNNKDYFDQSLDEIKLLKYVNARDPNDEMAVVRLYDYFYYKEHLFLVCELLRANLYEFQKYNRESGDEPYFTNARIQKVVKQTLKSLAFLHSLGLVHSDLKPENILIKSYSRCEIKVIDLGSSCFITDHLSSYVQSRAYRAPEVILGLPYDFKVDIWSLGCILAELSSGYVLFQNDSVSTLLCRLEGILGPIPDWMLQRGRYTQRYYTRSGMLYERNAQSKKFQLLVPKRTSLRHRLPEADEGLLDFIAYLLNIDPRKRPSALEALEHPWLQMEYPPIN